MEITNVRSFPVEAEMLKVYLTVTFDNCFVIRDKESSLLSSTISASQIRTDGHWKVWGRGMNERAEREA